MTADAIDAGYGTLRRLFDEPSRDFSPTPLWWWSGETVTQEGIARQLRSLRNGGVYNVVVINLAPAGPLFGAATDDPLWFSELWFTRFEQLCDEAESLGMRVWFYDQIGFSGANIQGRLTQKNPWAAGKSLRMCDVMLEANRSIAGLGFELESVLGVYTLPTDEHPHGRRVAFDGGGVIEGRETSVRVIHWKRTSFDYLNPDAAALLIDFIHGEFDRRFSDRLGKVIAGSFQDELPATNAWTDTFPDTFEREYGYDLMDLLPALFQASDLSASKVLHDYYSHRAALTEKAFFAPLGAWHAERGMLIGSDQTNPARAGWPTQSTQLYSDYFRTHRHYSAGGSDHEGDSKVHSSMAHLYGNPRTWLEAFHSGGWGSSLQDTYDWLLPFLRSGANLYNPHAVYYGTGGGWFEWAAPSTDWRQPYWGQYKVFADCVSRISSIMTWGAHVCSVAVLYPSATAKSVLAVDVPIQHFGDGVAGERARFADDAQATYLSLVGTNNWWRTNPGALNEAAIDFDVIDDDSLQASAIADGRATVRDESYRLVVVPSMRFIESKTATKLMALLDSGGRVLLVGAPSVAAAGTNGDDAAVAALMRDARLERFASVTDAVSAIGPSYRSVESELPVLVRTDGRGTSVAFVPTAQPNATAYPLRKGDAWISDFDFDASRYAANASIALPSDTAWAECWNPATGEGFRLPLDAAEGSKRVKLAFAGAPGVLVVWGAVGSPLHGFPYEVSGNESDEALDRRRDYLSEWRGTVLQTLDNAHGEYARPAADGPVGIRLWKLDHSEEKNGEVPPRSSWKPGKATFGVHGSVSMPSRDGVFEFVPWEYSMSRGIARDANGDGDLGPKGRVPATFVVMQAPAEGETARYRSSVRLPAAGEYEFILGAAAVKRAWLDGRLIAQQDAHGGYELRVPVQFAERTALLEYELREPNVGTTFFATNQDERLRSYFSFVRPGDWPAPPQYMRANHDGTTSSGVVSFSREIQIGPSPRRVVMTVGAAWPTRILVDGAVVKRQEFTEWYDAEPGSTPQVYLHDLSADLSEGRHTVALQIETPDADAVVYVDFAAVLADGSYYAVVSDDHWIAGVGGVSTSSVVTDSSWGETASQRVARRPHPLPAAEWLSGEPEVGRSAVPIEAGDSFDEHRQYLALQLPAGVCSLTIPTRLRMTASLGGAPIPLTPTDTGHAARFETPSASPLELLLVTEPTAFFRGGASLDGPVELQLATAPIALAPWAEIGLDWLSGAVRYETTVVLERAPIEAVLDLGELRGHVRITVNGEEAANLFCTPWSAVIQDFLVTGTNTVTLEIYNTLGPYLDDVSSTTNVYPSQKLDGLFGPVSLSMAFAPNRADGQPSLTQVIGGRTK